MAEGAGVLVTRAVGVERVPGVAGVAWLTQNHVTMTRQSTPIVVTPLSEKLHRRRD